MAGDRGRDLTEAVHRDGHGVLRGAVGDPIVRRAHRDARVEVERALHEAAEAPDAEERGPIDYHSVVNLCDRSRALRDVVFAPELARRAAETLGVQRVRLLYDQLFVKPPGAMVTMWHQDQVYWPVDTSDVSRTMLRSVRALRARAASCARQ